MRGGARDEIQVSWYATQPIFRTPAAASVRGGDDSSVTGPVPRRAARLRAPEQ